MRRFIGYALFFIITISYGKPAIDSLFNKIEKNKSAIEISAKTLKK